MPSTRQSWRFPDAYTFVLPLAQGALWLYNKPPNPRVAVKRDYPQVGRSYTRFQDLVAARAVGALVAAEQFKLDRAFQLRFAAAEGFVRADPVVLIVELTGRNCNLILTDPDGTILGVSREVTKEINRFRQLRAGLTYAPPPPYDKLDPRVASDDELAEAITGRTPKQFRKIIDGVGPQLTEAIARLANVSLKRQLDEDDVARVLPVIKQVVDAPTKMMQEALNLPDLETLRAHEAKAEERAQLKAALEKRKELFEKRIEDIDKVREAAAEADEIRQQADVLLAFQKQVPPHIEEVTLSDFAGNPLTLQLDPRYDAIGNAEQLYDKAKKREQRVEQAESREEDWWRELEETQALLEKLDPPHSLDDDTVAELHERFAKKPKTQYRAEPAMRYQSPQGFEVLVGRNAKANDVVTFKMARSRDLWLHVQGYHGSHVIVRAENREVPFETVIFAAKLAAGHSQARQSDNVPVDYTLKKNVWKVKGTPPGAVNFTQQKTVYVTPSRNPQEASRA